MGRFLYNKFIKPVFTINDTPHAIAMGVTLGVFVAFTPTVGIQMLTVVIIGTVIKANRIIGALLCWISNPITFIPMYYGYYWLGGKLLSIELWTFGNFSDRMNWVVAAKERLGYLTTLKLLLPALVASCGLACEGSQIEFRRPWFEDPRLELAEVGRVTRPSLRLATGQHRLPLGPLASGELSTHLAIAGVDEGSASAEVWLRAGGQAARLAADCSLRWQQPDPAGWRPLPYPRRGARVGGYPVGSGGIESANKFICHSRIKRSGAWWLETNCNSMLKLRCSLVNGTFDETFSKYVTRSKAKAFSRST